MKALSCLVEACSWLLRPRVRRFVIIPLLINITLFIAATFFTVRYSEQLMNHFLPANSWLHFLRWLLWPIVALSVVIVIFYGFSLLANIIAAPFNGALSAAVEEIAAGRSPRSGMRLSHEIAASLWQEVQKLIYFIMLAIPVLILSLLFAPIAPVLWFLYAAWCGALQYMDYPMSNNGVFFAAQRPRLRRKRLDVLGFGVAVTVMTTIPVVNFFAMPVCVIGATLYWCRTLRNLT